MTTASMSDEFIDSGSLKCGRLYSEFDGLEPTRRGEQFGARGNIGARRSEFSGSPPLKSTYRRKRSSLMGRVRPRKGKCINRLRSMPCETTKSGRHRVGTLPLAFRQGQ